MNLKKLEFKNHDAQNLKTLRNIQETLPGCWQEAKQENLIYPKEREDKFTNRYKHDNE